ncbi:DUF1048 domain-containing protein [Microbacterium jejuense]|uniref:DUF1048 domain-containing protein n=1 Tax=Microbacterium jejuense TaxID=1263637 RepID=UPI0031E7A7FA
MTLQIPMSTLTDLRDAHADVEWMPVDFRLAFDAFASYLARRLPEVTPDTGAEVLDDLAALFAEAATAGSPLRAVVGSDPAEIAEALLANHADAPGNRDARADLVRAIDAVTA